MIWMKTKSATGSEVNLTNRGDLMWELIAVNWPPIRMTSETGKISRPLVIAVAVQTNWENQSWRIGDQRYLTKCKPLTVKLSTWGLTHVAFSGRADAFCFNLTSWKWIYIWTKNNQFQDKYNKRDGLLKEEQEENWCCVCWRDEVQKCDKVKHFSKTLQKYDKVKKVLKLCKNVAKLKISLKMWQD